MSIQRFYDHRVSIVRRAQALDDGDPVVDDYNQPVVEETATTGIAAAIQPRSAHEMADFSQAGAAMSDHRIYMDPRDVRTGDAIVHDPAACPKTVDLPAGRYEVVGVPDAAGAGHHVEIAARLVAAPGLAYAAAAGAGS